MLKVIDLFSGQMARAYSEMGKVEEWIQLFLYDEGNNTALADGLKLEERVYIGPKTMPLGLFKRCCGPEPDMKYLVDEQGFQDRVQRICDRLASEWDMPPLIINYTDGHFELSDGNHRYEALMRNGIKEWDVIIWITGQEDYDSFKNNPDLSCYND